MGTVSDKPGLGMEERKASLAATASRLATIIASSDDAIVGKTLDGTVTDWNRAAETMFGYGASEMIGRSIALLLPPGHEAEEDAILDRLRRAVANPPMCRKKRCR